MLNHNINSPGIQYLFILANIKKKQMELEMNYCTRLTINWKQLAALLTAKPLWI